MNVRHEFQPCAPPPRSEPAPARQIPGRLRGAFLTGAALAALWAGLNAGDPASWVVGAPTVILGAAVTLLLPPAVPNPISVVGALRLAVFVAAGIMRGAFDVARRSLEPSSLRPGILIWHTALPEGGARRLFALTITLLPGTLTARLDGGTLVIHALERSAVTRADIGALEARIADLSGLSVQKGRS
ncbi:cation transporter [Roseivivax halodurans JCM 10272]|uniref:Cation transporter n=1 Tax=Roseivivax halodurans JCM 10272 TaxID=1449350 RepID=X7EEF2_9RHOB|nr:Na+/H+ antiporter subunit E [Roseivivax halodurans]ETX14255.1 cation transporter [Roseivivax halodurans JCM 10272]